MAAFQVFYHGVIRLVHGLMTRPAGVNQTLD
jgi:hypothetical protein